MDDMVNDLENFFKGKRVFVTGHTGFKGTWLCKLLISFGAEVTGYSLIPKPYQVLYELSGIERHMNSIIGDVRSANTLKKSVETASPNIVIHLAAQAIVRDSYLKPRMTYETNTMGTVNILEALRRVEHVKSFLNVTTDKVYRNNEWDWGYREIDEMGGGDPYSNSKACSELVTSGYKAAFFSEGGMSISTARAGNVIGGGDFAKDRIVPDCVRAALSGSTIVLRSPDSVRPYQHVLEPIVAYLIILQKQYENKEYEGSYNIGPNEDDCISTREIAELFCKAWGGKLTWITRNDDVWHEAKYLKLDCSRAKSKLNWQPRWKIKKAIEKTVEWTKVFANHDNVDRIMELQIEDFFKGS